MSLRLAGHVIIGASTPSEDPVTDGYVWIDTATDKLKICTSTSPYTWVEISGVGGASAWGDITGTLSDQTDLQSALDAKSAVGHTHVLADIPDGNGPSVVGSTAGAPTVLRNLGINPGLSGFGFGPGPSINVRLADLSYSDLPNLVTDLAAKQDLDSDLTAIAAIAPSNDDVIQRKAGAWTNRSMAQIKTDLVLVAGDVGLGNVNNTSDANKPVSTAQQTALDLKQSLSGKDAASGYAGLSAGSKLSGSQQTYGILANTACEGNDLRLSDSRAPTAHSINGAAHTFPGGGTTYLRDDGVFAAVTATPPALVGPKNSVSTVEAIAADTYVYVGRQLEITSTGSIEVPATSTLEISH